jgi:two-component system response regulator YesN
MQFTIGGFAMYSVLLVEDEKIELDTLRDYINWDKISVDKVYTARNGRSAYECIIQNEPDIMITDIQMPIMTGTELAKRVREEGYKTKIIFLTGYDDFEYVKEAFRVQATDYILKPFMTEELEKLLLKVEKQIDDESKTEESIGVAAKQMIEQMCRGNINEKDAESLSMYYFERSMEQVAYGLLAVYCVTEEELLHKDIEKLNEVYHSFLLGDVLVVVLYSHLYFLDGAKRIKSILEGNYSIVYFKDKIPLAQLKDRTEQLLNWKERIFFERKGEIFDADITGLKEYRQRMIPKKAIESKENLYKAIKNGETDAVEAILKEMLERFTIIEKEECIRQLYAFCYELKNHFVSGDPQLTTWMTEKEEDWEQNILKGRYWEDILNKLVSYCTNITSFFLKQQENPNYHIVVQIKDYLEHNYSETCSVEEMAEKVHLSPNYLRSIFKDSVGQTILEYVTEYRLLKACELLKNKTLRVKEVGRLVGYDNESYFGSVFAKKYGVSPNEYRKMV